MVAEADEDGTVVQVTSKGQATIPVDLRRRFGIPTPGRVRFVEEEGKLVVKPVRTPDEMRGSLRDRLPEGASLVDDLREERQRDFEREEQTGGSG